MSIHENNFHFLSGQGGIRNAYESATEYFEGSNILIVALDSNRSLGHLALGLEKKGISARVVEGALWIPARFVKALFNSPGLLVHFDALYLLPYSCNAPSVRPAFDLTTESEGVFESKSLQALARDMAGIGAQGYLADGCGLFIALADENIANSISSQLSPLRTHN